MACRVVLDTDNSGAFLVGAVMTRPPLDHEDADYWPRESRKQFGKLLEAQKRQKRSYYIVSTVFAVGLLAGFLIGVSI